MDEQSRKIAETFRQIQFRRDSALSEFDIANKPENLKGLSKKELLATEQNNRMIYGRYQAYDMSLTIIEHYLADVIEEYKRLSGE